MSLQHAFLWEKLKGDKIQCRLCNHFCLISPGERGECGVRENKGGKLFTHVRDSVAAANLDPVEKKPLFHFLPGTQSFSVGTMGCNFSCSFCQNSTLSQTPKETGKVSGEKLTGANIADAALQSAAGSISYTYSEPAIFTELILDAAPLAKKEGIKNILVTNGFQSPQCLETLSEYIHAANIDLKAFSEEFYREYCGGKLQPVLQNLKTVREMGLWLEVTTLIIPGLNDSPQEMQDMAGFIAEELGKSVPWHISRFHPTYKMLDRPSTPVETLEKALEAGKKAGLEYVYTGNIPGHDGENTYCPSCGEMLINRSGFSARKKGIDKGQCGKCGKEIAGVGLTGLD